MTGDLPEVRCPFPPRLSPHAAEVQRTATRWARHHGLLTDPRALAAFASAHFADLMARAYPEARYPDLCLATAWLATMFGLDDTLETTLGRDPARLRAVADVLLDHLRAGAIGRSTTLADGLGRPLARALSDVWRRTAARTGPAWRDRFLDHFAGYLEGAVWEARNRLRGRVPTVDEYLRIRRRTAATGIFFDLIEPFRDTELPERVRADDDYRALRRHADHVVGWFNDLVSWRKEDADGERHNLVLVLRAERGTATDTAVSEAVAMHNAEVLAFTAALARLRAGPHAAVPGLAGVTADLTHWLRANIDWSRRCGRYTTPGVSLPS